VALSAVLLLAVFEVGIRHAPPDGMTVTEVEDAGSAPFTLSYSYTTPRDQQTIAETYTTLNTAPTFNLLFARYNCPLASPRWPSSIAFTWHGIPLETWWTGDCVVSDNAGSISDDLLLIGHYWLPPPDGLPLPSPR